MHLGTNHHRTFDRKMKMKKMATPKMLFYHVPNVGDVCFPDTSTPPKQQQSWQTSMLESMG